MKTKESLVVGPDGQLEKKTTFEGVVELPKFKGRLVNGTIAITKLANKEVVLESGLILTGSEESKFVVVAVSKEVKDLEVGNIVAINFMHGNLPLQFVENQPISIVYPNIVSWVYEEKM